MLSSSVLKRRGPEAGQRIPAGVQHTSFVHPTGIRGGGREGWWWWWWGVCGGGGDEKHFYIIIPFFSKNNNIVKVLWEDTAHRSTVDPLHQASKLVCGSSL